MPVDTSQRTAKEEIMDDFALTGHELSDALDKIALINQWLGGNKITLDGLKKLTKDWPKGKPLSIIDIGCGNGDMCRAVADFAHKEGLNVTILGIDANAYTINHAQTLSQSYPDITYAVLNIFDSDFADLNYDIAVCTLTLHHFADQEIVSLMTLLTNKAKLGIVINDLQRSALAYRLFQLICFVFQLNDMSREDGLTSILRGFKRQDLEKFSKQLYLREYRITWKWAFRYQWIIKNLCL
ncbi:methyltransferase domain-containing protein [Spirosoma foliorum]|uniref:Methyltransferase domain-containing protein n=1 Tax=Spirosoma foliorum TaxID=2710596 RepID=A0A7G5GSX9_9BACT|nr:methyltransferase domain-containing protein [Spirosoma foliorum]QMW01971.1 methyltransferase domain-containing protein [Spirosoma foliorum]